VRKSRGHGQNIAHGRFFICHSLMKQLRPEIGYRPSIHNLETTRRITLVSKCRISHTRPTQFQDGNVIGTFF